MKRSRFVPSVLVAMLLVVALALPVSAEAEPGVDPPEVAADLVPGESITVDKTVTTSEIPPKPDIYFLADTTSRMGGVIAAVQADAGGVFTAISGLEPSAQFGVGDYKDFPHDAYAYQHTQNITDNVGDVQNAIDGWAADGGWDGPEGQFYALDRIANTDVVGWRDGSSKIVVWFGDSPAHDPVPAAATGLPYDITETTVIDALVAAGIRVIAISNVTAAGFYYPNALDDDPNNYGGDYEWPYKITENGSAGQATRIAAATGGVHLTDVESDEMVDAILEGLEALTTDVWGVVVSADPGLSVTLTPAVHHDVPGGDTVTFTEIIATDGSGPPCKKYIATVTFYAGSYPEGGVVIGEQDITVGGDIAPPSVWIEEAVKPHGKNVPPAGSSTLPGPKGGIGNDGFYQLFAEDNCDDTAEIEIFVSGFGPFADGDVVKITEAPGAAPKSKKMGSTKGAPGAIAAHIILPTDPVVTAVDTSGNVGTCTDCLVPAPPK